MPEFFIDNATRKRIVTFWIPVCLFFLHAWASALVIAVVALDRHNDTIEKMFFHSAWGIAALILLLISDKALEFAIERASNVAGAAVGKVVEKTITEKTVVKQPEPVQKMEVSAENVTVNPT